LRAPDVWMGGARGAFQSLASVVMSMPVGSSATALTPDPAQSQNIHNLGTAYFLAGDYATAASCFRGRITVNPRADLSRAFLVSVLGHLGEIEEARRVCRCRFIPFMG
jgi:Tfp pilus assembly protein PilF